MLSGRELWNASRRAKYAAAQVWYEFQCESCGTTVRACGKKKRRFCSRKCKNDVHNREWQSANADQLAAYRATPAFRQKAASRSRAYYADHREAVRAVMDARYLSQRRYAPWVTLLASAKSRAKERGLAFDLTSEWASVRWTGRCEVTDLPFAIAQPKNSPRGFWPTIDRIEPSKGYTQDNCRFILHAVNALKGELTDADMLRIATAIISKTKD